MNKKWLPILIVVVLAILVFLLKNRTETDKSKPKTTTVQPKETNTANNNTGFNRTTSLLKYSEHAKCRMGCRHISQTEVEDIMTSGKINYGKSDVKNPRCPRYALEGVTDDNQKVRIVFAQCKENTTVVTVIDLKTDFECHCPGDDDKYDNKR